MATLRELAERTGYSRRHHLQDPVRRSGAVGEYGGQKKGAGGGGAAELYRYPEPQGPGTQGVLRVGIAEMLTPAQQLEDPFYLYLSGFVRQGCLDRKYTAVPLESRGEGFLPPEGAAGRHDRHWKVPAGPDRGDGGALRPDRLLNSSPRESRFDSVVLNFSPGDLHGTGARWSWGIGRWALSGREWKLDDLGRRAPGGAPPAFAQQMAARGLDCRGWLLDCPMETGGGRPGGGGAPPAAGAGPRRCWRPTRRRAIGAIRALRLAGLDAPKDLSVVLQRHALLRPGGAAADVGVRPCGGDGAHRPAAAAGAGGAPGAGSRSAPCR